MPICPVHNREMAARTSSKGHPYTVCEEPGCDVICGAGPFSMPATRETMKLRHTAHQAFDPLWKNKLFATRRRAYDWLGNLLGLDEEACHFGKFNSEQCEMAMWYIDQLLGNPVEHVPAPVSDLPSKASRRRARKAAAKAERSKRVSYLLPPPPCRRITPLHQEDERPLSTLETNLFALAVSRALKERKAI